jgi:anti-sigma factor RsiW
MDKILSCADFETLLADSIDGTLSAPARSAERDAFLRHRETCPACAALAEDAESAMAFMERTADVEVPQALVSKILQATNSGWEFKLRGQGVSGWINRTFAPVLRPRIVMGAAMMFLSATMLTRCTPSHTFTTADLDPVHLWVSLDDKAHRIWSRTVKSYESMRLVYEVKNQINDWAEQQKQQDEAAADAKADQRQLNTKQSSTAKTKNEGKKP